MKKLITLFAFLFCLNLIVIPQGSYDCQSEISYGIRAGDTCDFMLQFEESKCYLGTDSFEIARVKIYPVKTDTLFAIPPDLSLEKVTKDSLKRFCEGRVSLRGSNVRISQKLKGIFNVWEVQYFSVSKGMIQETFATDYAFSCIVRVVLFLIIYGFFSCLFWMIVKFKNRKDIYRLDTWNHWYCGVGVVILGVLLFYALKYEMLFFDFVNAAFIVLIWLLIYRSKKRRDKSERDLSDRDTD